MDDEIKKMLLIVNGTSGNADLEEKLALVMQEYHSLWKIKQRKYGPNNIASMGKSGLVIRMNDKFQRLKRFILQGVEGDIEGSEEDAWMDIAGYALMGVMVGRGWWPECDPDWLTLEQVMFVIERFVKEQYHGTNQD